MELALQFRYAKQFINMLIHWTSSDCYLVNCLYQNLDHSSTVLQAILPSIELFQLISQGSRVFMKLNQVGKNTKMINVK